MPTSRSLAVAVSGGFVIHKEMGESVLPLSRDFSTNDQAPDPRVIFSRALGFPPPSI